MRISTDKDDTGYVTTRDFYPYLDGESIRNVVTADEELGYILRYKINEHGFMYVDSKADLDTDGIATEEVYGKVEIKRGIDVKTK